MPAKHRDPQTRKSASIRSCTPDRNETTEQSPAPLQSVGLVSKSSPQKGNLDGSPTNSVSSHVLMTRFKSLVSDIIEHSGFIANADDFIAVAEDGIKDMRAAKVLARSSRSSKSLNTPSAKAATPHKGEKERHLPITLNAPSLVDSDGKEKSDGADGGKSGGNTSRSYAAILQGKTSPKKVRTEAVKTSLEKADELNQRSSDTIVEDRASTAFRSEERRREAESRRKEMLLEKKSKQSIQAERSQQAKERREEATERMKQEAEERVAKAAKRQEEAVSSKRDAASKAIAKVDEVLFVNQMTAENKALKHEQKMAEIEKAEEEKRAEKQKRDQVRSDAHNAVVERGKEIQEEKLEKSKLREQQREEAKRRAEEAKRLEAERKAQKKEEREKTVRSHKEKAESEAEARTRKEKERQAHSEQLRVERMAQQKEKADKHGEKMKEVRERKEKEDLKNPTFNEMMPAVSTSEEERISAKFNKAIATSARQSKVFREQYQKESSHSQKDLNKSKLRPIVARLGGGTNLTQARQPLHDLLNATKDLSSVDQEHVRYFDCFEPLLKILSESRKAHDGATFKLCSSLIHKLLSNPGDKEMKSVHYFIRAGHLVPLVLMIHDEIKALKKHNHSPPLTACFSLLQLCMHYLCGDAVTTSMKQTSLRDQTMDILDVAGVDAFCLAVASTCVDEEDMPCLQCALSILLYQVEAVARKNSPKKDSWLQRVVESMLTLLQNILTPSGQTVESLSNLTTCVLFSAMRILNVASRMEFNFVHELFGNSAETGSTATMEIFHVVSAFFKYVAAHDEFLERIPATQLGSDASPSTSFAEAMAFGTTHKALPRVSLDSEGKYDPTKQPTMLRAVLHELLLFIGYISMGDEQVQDVFAWGKDQPLMSLILGTLPIQYFAQCKHILFPTLVCLGFEHTRNREIMEREMDLESLAMFLKEEIAEIPAKQKHRLTDEPPRCKEDPAAAGSSSKPRAKSPKKSWAEMMDDDDDDMSCLANAPALKESATATAKPNVAKKDTQEARDKDALLKSVVTTKSRHYASHFLLTRRFPIFKWNDAVSYFEPKLE